MSDDIKTLREAADVKLITFHTCFFRGDHYDKHDPVDINPAYIVGVYPIRATAGGQHSQLRLHGDATCQDWLMVHESPDDVRAAILCRREIERMDQEASVVSIKEITADALSAARDEGWNALIDHLTLKPSPLDLNTVAERLDAMRYLRKGPSND